MVGEKVLHYHIIEKLGEGGMGVVYKARDTHLDRIVALKFLPPHLISNSEIKERFIREAKAASSLDHPNICTIHEIGETENEQMFIVMSFYDGQTLRRKLLDGPLTVDESINVSLQICNALSRAHENGITHRDIKPANIIVTSHNEVKILDFGLAKTATSDNITTFGSTVGTISYMSPEQAKGEGVDHRTDIWSTGVVLYEMLTGENPFKGDYDQAVVYSILNEEARSVSKINPDVPEELNKIILKSLQKEKEKRYNNIDEMINDLRELKSDFSEKFSSGSKEIKPVIKKSYFFYGISAIIILLAAFFLFKQFQPSGETTEETSGLKRLAILPFTNIKNDAETNYLGFALADQIIGSLAYVQNVLVRPSSTIRKYENQNINPADIGNELKVDFILTGNYLKESDMVRLNLEMVDVSSNEIIWRNDFDVNYKNTFTLQDVVTDKVVNGLKIKFIGGDKHIDAPKDPLAYEYYLKGISYPLDTKSNHAAINILNKAAEIDPGYAPVFSELGYRYQLLATYEMGSIDKAVDAENSYLKALSINKDLLSALGNLAAYYTETGRTIEAVQLIKRALKINPNNADAHFWLGYIYRYTGLLEESADEMETALKLDPGNPRFRTIGTTYAYMGRFEDAINGYQLDKESALSKSWIGVIYYRMNKLDMSKKYLQESIEIDKDGIVGLWAKVLLNYIEGKYSEGIKLIETLVPSVYDGEQFYNYSNLYALYDKKEESFNTLRKAIDAGFYCYPHIKKDIFWDNVRDEPEFRELLELTKIKSENFRKKLAEL